MPTGLSVVLLGYSRRRKIRDVRGHSPSVCNATVINPPRREFPASMLGTANGCNDGSGRFCRPSSVGARRAGREDLPYLRVTTVLRSDALFL